MIWQPVSSKLSTSITQGSKHWDLWLLSAIICTQVRGHAVEVLKRTDDEELRYYLLQLVQALRYEAVDNSRLATFIVQRASKNPVLGVLLHWWEFWWEIHSNAVKIWMSYSLNLLLPSKVDDVVQFVHCYTALGGHSASIRWSNNNFWISVAAAFRGMKIEEQERGIRPVTHCKLHASNWCPLCKFGRRRFICWVWPFSLRQITLYIVIWDCWTYFSCDYLGASTLEERELARLGWQNAWRVPLVCIQATAEESLVNDLIHNRIARDLVVKIRNNDLRILRFMAAWKVKRVQVPLHWMERSQFWS